VFPETEEFIQTDKCYKTSSRVLARLRPYSNKKKVFKDKTKASQIQFNKQAAYLLI